MTARFIAFFGFLFCLWAEPTLAQDPVITVSSDQDDALVGQPFVITVDVLVPTFMPKAPVFPNFEVPGLIVRLPERSTSPISKRIEGATWAGVRRTYRLYPTRAGTIEIPPQEISITYKDTATNEDIPLTVEVPATQFDATVPAGARSLDPLIIAADLNITQSWQVAENELAVGDAVVRNLEIAVSGASALFVPPLLDAAPPGTAQAKPVEATDDEALPLAAAFLSYPEDARVTERIERGVMSGTRTEQVSYVVQSGGAALFPDIRLSWYNLNTKEIEEIVLPGRSVTVTMPPRVRQPLNPEVSRRAILFLLLLLLVIWAARRWLWPHMRPKVRRLRNRYAASAHAAHRHALKKAKNQDLTGLFLALDVRTERGFPTGKTLQQTLEKLTKALYRDGADPQNKAKHWHAVRRALRHDGPGLFRKSRRHRPQGLPALNPFTDG